MLHCCHRQQPRRPPVPTAHHLAVQLQEDLAVPLQLLRVLSHLTLQMAHPLMLQRQQMQRLRPTQPAA